MPIDLQPRRAVCSKPRPSRWRYAGLSLVLGTLVALFPSPTPAADPDDALLETNARLLEELERAQRTEVERRAEAAREKLRREATRESDARTRREQERAGIDRRRAEEEAIKARIAEEARLQDEMLQRTKRNDAAMLRENIGAHAEHETDPNNPAMLGARKAPRAPMDRDLPRAIFDESKTEVPAGTWGNRRKLRVIELVLDADGDGKAEVRRYLDRETETPLHQAEDRNYDGQIDSWKNYENGELVLRILDQNDDGHPDVWEAYLDGRLRESQADRDDDGIKDSYYIYAGSTLQEERHDANNDGEIDLFIFYDDGRRDHAEEDRDKDGRKDTWTRYGLVDNTEIIVRIERDERGRGYADTFESFEAVKGRAILNRREEDVNGDGQIDLVSIYEKGKLVRREILNPEAVSL